jgi:hypothetical protein
MFYLSLCCVVKDEDLFIGEWLTYHSLLGVEHFYIYDNESAKPVCEHPAVARYINAGRATVHLTEGTKTQRAVYYHCLKNYAKQNYWIGFLDLDEFICFVPEAGKGKSENSTGAWVDFRTMLAEFENYGGLALNWRTFTSAGHELRPKGLVIKNYCHTRVEPDKFDLHVKSFVRPDLVVKVSTPHSFKFKEGSFTVNEKHHPMAQGWPFFPLSRERAWINHYYFKSREDFEYKIARGRADTGEQRNQQQAFTAFEQQQKILTTEDSHAAKLAPLVEKYAEALPPCMPVPDIAQGLEGYLSLVREILNYNNDKFWFEFYAGYQPSQAEKFNRAEAVLCKAMELYADDVQLWVLRAYLARHQLNFRLAEQFLNKALALQEHPCIHEEFFHLALVQGNKDEAKAFLFYLTHLPYKDETDAAFAKRLGLYAKILQ